MATSQRRPVRIAGISGSASDRRFAMARLAQNYEHDPVDVIIGDWLSEANMTASAGRLAEASPRGAYERSFLSVFRSAFPLLAKHNIKVVVNAGASDPLGLYKAVVDIIKGSKLDGKYTAAWIEGDSVLSTIESQQAKGVDFQSLDGSGSLKDWKFKPIFAQAYLGGLGITKALEAGADIVVCGRVSDASLVTGPAIWWHGWKSNQLDQLANAFIAGHLIECSNYVCGGNYSGFKEIPRAKWADIGYPIAEIAEGGEVVITKEKGSGGEVTEHTCSAQLLYEIQGPWYFNSDVTAVIDNIGFERVGPDRVIVRGVKSLPPPSTTKVGITALAGYQAEIHYFLVGLDIKEKAMMLEDQLRYVLAPYKDKFTLLDFSLYGSAAENPRNQNSATVDFRVLVQAPNSEDIGGRFFSGPVTGCQMQAYPGATLHLDLRTSAPKPIYEYFVTLLPQSTLRQRVHLMDGQTLIVKTPQDDGLESAKYPRDQPSQMNSGPSWDLSRFGETISSPLGYVAHARSGDKGSNANVGIWVRRQDEYDWLRGLLSVEMIQVLLGDEYRGGKIDRVEFPNLRAVHFLLYNHLDRGVSCTSSYDFLGKNVAEFLRARHVEIPVKFLNRGKI